MNKASRPEASGELTTALLDQAAAAALRMVDPVQGGTLGAPKFPQPSFFKFLWHSYRRTGSAMTREAVTLTLRAMCQGGIYDHLGGGFARYATDDAWLVPHFEKMLYDNALLLDLLTEVWQETRDPLLARRARETAEWVLGDMRVGDGRVGDGDDGTFAFASARDADSEGEEGRYYVWTEAEIDACPGRRRGAVQGGLRRRSGRQLGGPHHPQPQPKPAARRRRLRGPPGALPRPPARRPRHPPGAAARRQGPGRLERPDDRRSRLRRPGVRPTNLVGRRGGRLRLRPPAHGRGRPAAPFLAPGQAAPRCRPRRLRQHEPRRPGPLRAERPERLSGTGRRLGGASPTAIIGTIRGAAISLPPTTRPI